MEKVSSLLVDTAERALPSIGRIEVAFPETELTIPCLVVRTVMGTQREVGVGQHWHPAGKANIYDVSANYEVYGNDQLDTDQMADELSDYIAKNRDGMKSWTDPADGQGASMIDCRMVGIADYGYVDYLDCWHKTLSYEIPVSVRQT